MGNVCIKATPVAQQQQQQQQQHQEDDKEASISSRRSDDGGVELAADDGGGGNDGSGSKPQRVARKSTFRVDGDGFISPVPAMGGGVVGDGDGDGDGDDDPMDLLEHSVISRGEITYEPSSSDSSVSDQDDGDIGLSVGSGRVARAGSLFGNRLSSSSPNARRLSSGSPKGGRRLSSGSPASRGSNGYREAMGEHERMKLNSSPRVMSKFAAALSPEDAADPQNRFPPRLPSLDHGRGHRRHLSMPNSGLQPHAAHDRAPLGSVNPALDDDEFDDDDDEVAMAPPKLIRAVTVETDNVVENITKDGRKQINQYTIVRKLGRGSFAHVKLAYNENDGNYYAMKIMSKSWLKRKKLAGRRVVDNWSQVEREIAIMKKLDHEHIVRLWEVIDDPNTDQLYLIMDYVENGAVMSDEIETDPLSEDLARAYFRDLIAGLAYIHGQHVLHRDIKPENLLLTKSGRIKIADFGVSQLFTAEDRVRNTAGSAAFMCPEMCQGASDFSGKQADIWSCGVTLFMFVFGVLPFYAEGPAQIYEKIANDPLVFPHEDLDPSLLDLLRRLLTKDPKERIHMPDILVHPWVTKDNTWPMPAVDVTPIEVTQGEIECAFSRVGSWLMIINIKTKVHHLVKQMRARKRARIAMGQRPRSNSLAALPSRPLVRAGNDGNNDSSSNNSSGHGSGQPSNPAVASTPAINSTSDPALANSASAADEERKDATKSSTTSSRLKVTTRRRKRHVRSSSELEHPVEELHAEFQAAAAAEAAEAATKDGLIMNGLDDDDDEIDAARRGGQALVTPRDDDDDNDDQVFNRTLSIQITPVPPDADGDDNSNGNVSVSTASD